MAKKKAQGSFEAFGFGSEYMIVDGNTLLPVAAGAAATDRGEVAWTNARVPHIMELRTSKPVKTLPDLTAKLANEVRTMNAVLRPGRMLLPTGANPFMDPGTFASATSLEDTGTVDALNRIFHLRSHGWCNAMGSRIELPFANDDEFGKLHTAIRMVLPIIPAISAASPFLLGKRAATRDARSHELLNGTCRLPELIGSFIPEVVFNQEDYYRVVYEPIALALADQEVSSALDYHAANSRGAVASFDRGVISIRVADTQECPGADMAIAELVIAVVKAMVAGRWVSNYLQRAWHENDLLALLKDIAKGAEGAVIANRDFLLMFGMLRESATASELWRHLYNQLCDELSDPCRLRIAHILDHGCLASRILRRTGEKPSHETIVEVYRELATCLQEDRAFT